jgi:predicted DNA binding protein
LPCCTMLSSSCCWTNLLFLIPDKVVQLYTQWEADVALDDADDSDSSAGSAPEVASDISTMTHASANSRGITPRGSPASALGDSDAPTKPKKAIRRRPPSTTPSKFYDDMPGLGLVVSSGDDDDVDDVDDDDDDDTDDALLFSRKRRNRNSDVDHSRSKKRHRSSSVPSVTPRKETSVPVDLTMAEGTCSIYCSIYCSMCFIHVALKFMPTFALSLI